MHCCKHVSTTLRAYDQDVARMQVLTCASVGDPKYGHPLRTPASYDGTRIRTQEPRDLTARVVGPNTTPRGLLHYTIYT